jgi:hypothetical protein
MRGYLISFLLVTVFGILSSCKARHATLTAAQMARLPENTYVDHWTAQEMIDNYKCDDCKDDEVVTFNNALFIQIREEIPIKRWDFVRIRYRDGDRRMYASRNQYGETEERSDIDGHASFLLRITTEKNRQEYFDITVICPPPRGCEPMAPDSTKKTMNPKN